MGFLESYKANHTHPVNRVLHTLGIPMIVVAVVWFLVECLQGAFPHWPWILGLFVLGWVLQFIGHAFEKKWPSFFESPLYLLIGPIWWLLKILGRQDKKKKQL